MLLLRSSADTRDSIILISLIMLRSLVGSSKINQYFVCLSNINRGPFFGRPCLFLLTIFIYLPLYNWFYQFWFSLSNSCSSRIVSLSSHLLYCFIFLHPTFALNHKPLLIHHIANIVDNTVDPSLPHFYFKEENPMMIQGICNCG